MSEPHPPGQFSLTLTRVTRTEPATYTLAEAARLAGVHPEMLRYYCRLGFFGPSRAEPNAPLLFDDDALYELRRFEHYRRHRGMSRTALRTIWTLLREVERLRAEVRFLRER